MRRRMEDIKKKSSEENILYAINSKIDTSRRKDQGTLRKTQQTVKNKIQGEKGLKNIREDKQPTEQYQGV